MLGIFLNLILIALATLSLATGISFFIQERDSGYLRVHILLFNLAVFCICAGYGLMAFIPDIRYAPIPRLIGFAGIDFFLLAELSFVFRELNVRYNWYLLGMGFFIAWALLDIVIFGRPSVVEFIRLEYYTIYSHDNMDERLHAFHYIFVSVIGLILFVHGVLWFKTKTLKRDKRFVLELILSNFIILFASITDIVNADFTHKFPSFSYSSAIAFTNFSLWFFFKQHIVFNPTVKNVSKEVFYSIDVPVLIFDMEGKVKLFNPCAQKTLRLQEEADANLRSVFTLSDVETLILLNHSKQGNETKLASRIKADDKECQLCCSIKKDNLNEPFCIICTVLPR